MGGGGGGGRGLQSVLLLLSLPVYIECPGVFFFSAGC